MHSTLHTRYKTLITIGLSVIVITALLPTTAMHHGWLVEPFVVNIRAQAPRSLLSGKVEDYGTSRKTCLLAGTNGALTMAVEGRGGDYAMCCVRQGEPLALIVGQELSAQIVLEKEEHEFHVKIENANREPIFMHAKRLPKGPSTVSLLISSADLQGASSFAISRFCVAAVGDGEPQTVRVTSASVSPRRFRPRP